jgi:uncharacterized membrane protein
MPRTATKPPNPRRSSATRRAKAAGAGNGRAPAKKPSPVAAKKPSPAAAKKRSPAAAKKRSPAATANKPSAAAAKKSASAVKHPVKEASKPVKAAAKAAGKKALKAMLRRAARTGAKALQGVAARGAEVSRGAVLSGLSRHLPVQVSIDVAVPIAVAWEEWTSLDSLSEGVRKIEDIERDGNQLRGRTAGPWSSDWAAEIVDEREQQSLAWRSLEATDCAGLVTFHRLSERLTRIELDLDVVPRTPADAFSLSSHLAHRRAESELRRFKARVEFINPDVYEAAAQENGSAPASNGNE